MGNVVMEKKEESIKDFTVMVKGTKWTVNFVSVTGDKPQWKGRTASVGIKKIQLNAAEISAARDEQGMFVDYREVINHELIHAFLFECGLNNACSGTSNWSRNEEMVDWFANEMPDITTAVNQLYKKVSKFVEKEMCRKKENGEE